MKPKRAKVIYEDIPSSFLDWTYDEAGITYDEAGYVYGDIQVSTGWLKPSKYDVFVQTPRGGVIVEKVKGESWL